AYLVIASPVQYIARFLGRGKHTIFIADAFDFPEEIIGQAIAIYIALLALACMTAYITGYLKRIRSVEKKELEDAASARWEARKAEREARQGVSNAPESAWKPEIKREMLARETEKRLRELNREKILRTILFLVLWSAADVLAWFLWSKYSGSDMLSPSAVFFTMLLVVPFWPLKKYEVFLGKTYYAQVAEIRQRGEALSQAAWRRAGGLHKGITPPENQRGCWEVYLRPKGGASEKLVFSGKDHLNFQPGDYVLKLSAFKYPVNCHFDEAHDVYCPNCGRSNPLGRKRCADCHFPLARRK
ncbi:MAG: hypothetical protein ACI4V1_01490, partial [Eubacteriales bacterium]